MTEPLPPNRGVEYHQAMGMDDSEGGEQAAIPSFLRDPSGLVRRRWRWMLLALVVGLLSAMAVVARIKPRYVASATIQVTSQQIPVDLVRSTVPEDPLARVNAMLGIILSRREIATLIEEHDLYPDLRESETLAAIVEKTRRDIGIDENPNIAGGPRGGDAQSARLFTVSFEADRADVAAAVANDVAGRITNESIRSRTRQATMTTEFLAGELERAETDLRKQSQEITAFKELHRGELPSNLAANLSKLDRFQQQRQSLSLQIAEAETRLATLATMSSASGVQDVAPPETQLFALRQELANELVTRTERHPNVIALQGKIASLEKEAGLALGEEAESADSAAPKPTPSRRTLLEASQHTIAELTAQLAYTEHGLRILDEQVTNTPARQEALTALEQRETVLRENYLEFLRKVQDAELAQSLEAKQHGQRFSIIDPAVEPTSPIRKRWEFAVLGALASLALSLGVGVLLEISDPVLLTVDQLASVSELPVLGSVPRI